ncbi:unnamed protein product, partial [marine sediment metagenome]
FLFKRPLRIRYFKVGILIKILTLSAAKVIGQKRVINKTLDLAIKFAKSVKNPRFGIAHVAAPELAQWYGYKIRNVFNSSKVMISEASPALSVHIGIGGAAIAVLGDS